jgi:hypothetical protein
MNRAFRWVLGTLLVLVIAPGSSWAQATAQINGTVADSSGGVLPGVTVIAIQTATGFRRETVSDGTGSYVLLNLPLGPYRLEATLAGFRTFTQTGIVLQVNSNPVIPVTLQLGSLEETVSVEAAAPLVETRNPAIGGVVDSEAVEALPLEGRNPVALITLSGAAVDLGEPTSRSMTSSGRIAIAGGQQWGVAYSLDGAMHNNVLDGLNLPLPFPDALQEFRVETSSQNSERGRQGNGSVSVVTKSGTNLFHGDLFEFARHHRFNAPSYFAAVDPATGKKQSDGLVRNQFGGTLGGPVVRDRVFFFGAYQGTRSSQAPADIIAFVPTEAMRAGDFTAFASAACNSRGAVTLRAPFVNNRIAPALFSPAATAILGRFPAPSDPCGRTTFSRTTKPYEGQIIGKGDWQITQNQSLFARYMNTVTKWDPALVYDPDNLLTGMNAGAGGRDNYSHSFALGYTQVLSNTAVNNIRLAVNRTQVFRTHAPMFGPEDVGVNIYTYIPERMLITITGGFNVNHGTETDSWYRPNTMGISDDLSLVRGNHQLALGGALGLSDWKTNSNVRSPGAFSFNGGATGLGLADFMVGAINEYRQANPFTLDIKQTYIGVYAQDTWRMSPNVTLNLGVRWEPWFPQEHQQNQIYSFDLARYQAGERSSVFSQAPPGLRYPGDEGFPTRAGMERVWFNVQPRAGVSWDPTGEGRTSVRAGYGMNSNFVAGEFYFDAGQAPPFGLEQRLFRLGPHSLDDPWAAAGRPNPYPNERGTDTEFPPYSLLIMVPQDLKTTRVHSWNLGIQQQIGESTAVSASYLANRMTNVWGVVVGNPGNNILPSPVTAPCTLRLPGGGTQSFGNCATAPLDLRRDISQANPEVGQYIGPLDWVTDAGWQQYHGLLLSAQHRLTNGLTGTANYTWSTCEGLINQGGGPLNLGTGYTHPQSLINPPSEAESKELFERDKGRCADSRTHIVNLTASVQTPEFASAAMRAIASGWRLSGIFRASSGDYLSVSAGGDRSLTGVQNNTQRAHQVLDDPYGDGTIDNWLNPDAFEQPAFGEFGNSPRNGFDGPGRRSVDVSLVRTFQIGSVHRIDARVEAFNVFNWNNWNNPQTAVNNANFGRILGVGAPRIMQFALKYAF